MGKNNKNNKNKENKENLLFYVFSLVFIRFPDQKSGQKPVENLAKNLAKCPLVLGPKSQVCETL